MVPSQAQACLRMTVHEVWHPWGGKSTLTDKTMDLWSFSDYSPARSQDSHTQAHFLWKMSTTETTYFKLLSGTLNVGDMGLTSWKASSWQSDISCDGSKRKWAITIHQPKEFPDPRNDHEHMKLSFGMGVTRSPRNLYTNITTQPFRPANNP